MGAVHWGLLPSRWWRGAVLLDTDGLCCGLSYVQFYTRRLAPLVSVFLSAWSCCVVGLNVSHLRKLHHLRSITSYIHPILLFARLMCSGIDVAIFLAIDQAKVAVSVGCWYLSSSSSLPLSRKCMMASAAISHSSRPHVWLVYFCCPPPRIH